MVCFTKSDALLVVLVGFHLDRSTGVPASLASDEGVTCCCVPVEPLPSFCNERFNLGRQQ